MKTGNSHRFVFQAETDRRVRQWHFSFQNFLILALVSLFVLGTSLFFGAEYLTRFLYQQKLQGIRNNFTSLSIALNDINGKLIYLDQKMDTIEEKERAVRIYANLPEIDQDVRSLGIGGLQLEKYTSKDYIIPGLSKKISGLELDVDHLARKVKLELASFETIYDKVVKDTEKMKHIPSIRPVPGGYLNSRFGYRKDPFDGVQRFHKGLDFSVFTGTPVYAPADGVIQSARYRGKRGKHIKINHEFGYNTLFLHLSKINVKQGQKVKRGDLIGKTGNSGRSTAPHLHYEVHYNGVAQNPMDYFFSGILN